MTFQNSNVECDLSIDNPCYKEDKEKTFMSIQCETSPFDRRFPS